MIWAMLVGRLSQFNPTSRQALRAGSVFGEIFPREEWPHSSWLGFLRMCKDESDSRVDACQLPWPSVRGAVLWIAHAWRKYCCEIQPS